MMSVKQIYAKIANRKISLLSKYMPGRCNCEQRKPVSGGTETGFWGELRDPCGGFKVCLLSPPESSSGMHLCVSDGFLKKETVTGTRIDYLAIMPTRRNANIQTYAIIPVAIIILSITLLAASETFVESEFVCIFLYSQSKIVVFGFALPALWKIKLPHSIFVKNETCHIN